MSAQPERRGLFQLLALRRWIKRLIVDAGLEGWLTPEQAGYLINRLGLRHE